MKGNSILSAHYRGRFSRRQINPQIVKCLLNSGLKLIEVSTLEDIKTINKELKEFLLVDKLILLKMMQHRTDLLLKSKLNYFTTGIFREIIKYS